MANINRTKKMEVIPGLIFWHQHLSEPEFNGHLVNGYQRIGHIFLMRQFAYLMIISINFITLLPTLIARRCIWYLIL